jgi:hypothetical protein
MHQRLDDTLPDDRTTHNRNDGVVGKANKRMRTTACGRQTKNPHSLSGAWWREEHSLNSSWDSTLQIFSYHPNSFVNQQVIWNPDAWLRILGVGHAPKELGK